MNAGMMARDGTGGTRDAAAAVRYFGNACKLGEQAGCNEAQALKN
jgi:TPR repeat protein